MAKETQLDERSDREGQLREDRWLVCVGCGHALARHAARIEIEGRHTHTFTNPSGHTYTIGCFGDVPGAVGVGDEETYWSWFPGHAWRVAACARCAAHVGWSFRKEAAVFWGLIAERVRG